MDDRPPDSVDMGAPGTVPSTGEVGAPPARPRVSRGALIGIVVVVVAVGVGVVVLGVAVASGPADPLSPGPGAATISWTSTSADGSPRQPFSGTIDGLAVSGVSINTLAANDLPAGSARPLVIPQAIHGFQWKGTFNGTSFNLGVYLIGLGSATGAGPLGSPGPTFRITGTYGKLPVTFLARPPTGLTPSNVTSLPFSGSVGTTKITGSVRIPTRSGTKEMVTASYTVAS